MKHLGRILNSLTPAMAKRFGRLSGLATGLLLALFTGSHFQLTSPSVHAEDSRDIIDQALYSREEFFGSQAFVPFPTSKMRENLAALAKTLPEDAEVALKLAETDEKLEKF